MIVNVDDERKKKRMDFFFFKQKTAYEIKECDWSSDVCSSDLVPRKRARHIITEDRRVEEFVAASANGDPATMGKLFLGSHRSLQHDYEVSCEELDFLVDTAIGIAGVYGARMTGGGFGGCTVNLMAPGAGAAFRQTISRAYKAKFSIDPVFYPVRPSDGAGRVI